MKPNLGPTSFSDLNILKLPFPCPSLQRESNKISNKLIFLPDLQIGPKLHANSNARIAGWVIPTKVYHNIGITNLRSITLVPYIKYNNQKPYLNAESI